MWGGFREGWRGNAILYFYLSKNFHHKFWHLKYGRLEQGKFGRLDTYRERQFDRITSPFAK